MKDFNDKEWTDFIEECKDRVELDNKEFGINSVFLPNPAICRNPKYCLIAMEPNDDENRLKELKNDLKGYQNFIEGYKELIIHYCAHCNLGEYYITDISKGSMTMADAKKKRSKRYAKWKVLLKKEIELLRNGKKITIIPLGSNVETYVKELWHNDPNVNVVDYIYHYSQSNLWRINKYSNSKKIADKDLESFVDLFMEHLNYEKKRIPRIKKIIYNKERLKEVSKFYAYYSDKFQSIKQQMENKQ